MKTTNHPPRELAATLYKNSGKLTITLTGPHGPETHHNVKIRPELLGYTADQLTPTALYIITPKDLAALASAGSSPAPASRHRQTLTRSQLARRLKASHQEAARYRVKLREEKAVNRVLRAQIRALEKQLYSD